jgi:hypothetical protein
MLSSCRGIVVETEYGHPSCLRPLGRPWWKARCCKAGCWDWEGALGCVNCATVHCFKASVKQWAGGSFVVYRAARLSKVVMSVPKMRWCWLRGAPQQCFLPTGIGAARLIRCFRRPIDVPHHAGNHCRVQYCTQPCGEVHS